MMPAAKHFDPVIGIDIHIIQPPGPVPPVPVPHPFIGIVFDPMDYVPILGATVLVNGLPRAIAGTSGKATPPHIPIGGMFVIPPANDCEMFMGSATVVADGDAMSHAMHRVLSCNDVGMPAPPRTNPKKGTKLKSLYLPTSMVMPIPAGMPVLVGGPPTISMSVMAMKVAGKVAKKAFSKIAKFAKKTFKPRKFPKPRAKPPKSPKPSHHVACGQAGEPIDVITGANLDQFLDFQIPGDIPFDWTRYYRSDHADRLTPGGLGRGFRHSFDHQLDRDNASGRMIYTLPDGDLIEFPDFPDARSQAVNAHGLTLVRNVGDAYEIDRNDGTVLRFTRAPRASHWQLKHISAPQGLWQCLYDDQNRLREIQDSLWRLDLEYGPDGGLKRLNLNRPGQPPRPLAHYDRDALGRLVVFRDALGQTGRYEYNPAHLMTKKTDRRGYAFHYRYDAQGRCIHTYGDDGLYDVKLSYHPESRFSIAAFADGATSVYHYNGEGVITDILGPGGGVTGYETDDAGRVTKERDPLGHVTAWIYNRQGGFVLRRGPCNELTQPLHIEPNPPDPFGYELPDTMMEWEHGGLVDPEELRTVDTLEAAPDFWPAAFRDQVKRDATDPIAVRTEYDLLGRKVLTIHPDGSAERWGYDPNGNIANYQDRDGAAFQYEYGSWNLLKRAIDPLGRATEFQHNPREEITKVTAPAGVIHEYAYDPGDRLTDVKRHGRVRERYTHDVAGNLIGKTNDAGETLLRIEVGPSGLLRTRTLADGARQEFAYDANGRLIQAKAPGATVIRTYDASGRITQDTINGKGVHHVYQGRHLASTTTLDRFRTVYKREGSWQTITDPTGRTHRIHIRNDGIITRQYAHGTLELIRYDRAGRCVAKLRQAPGGDVWRRIWTYSPGGNLLQHEDSAQGLTRYVYDRARRLTARIDPQGRETAYRWDAADNLLEQPGLTAVRIAEGNRLIQANQEQFLHNNRNHIERRTGDRGTTRYVYNALDWLTDVEAPQGLSWTASYDPLGRRIRKTWSGHARMYYWDGFRLAAESRESGEVRIYLHLDETAFVPFAYVDYPNPDADPSSGALFYVVTNHIGAPVLVEDAQGRPVWRGQPQPFGDYAPETPEPPLPHRFPGHWHDPEIDLHYNRFRYYEPTLGRYLQSDPLGLAGGLNLYGYPTNPLISVDLDGLHPKQAKGSKSPGKTETGSSGEKGMVYEPSAKHGQAKRGTAMGVSNPAPKNGQAALDNSVQIKETSPRRVGVDAENKEIVIFDETHPGKGVYHGHTREWNELTDDMKNALSESGKTNRRGKLL